MKTEPPSKACVRPNIRVLLIEDNPLWVKLLRSLLEEQSAPVDLEAVHQVGLALERLKYADFDLILSDLSLPDSPQDQTFATLRAGAPETPIIILTGLDDEETAMRMVEQGAQDYLVKSRIDYHSLIGSLRHAIERHRFQGELQDAHDELEKHVAERTAELRERTAELQSALAQLQAAQQRIVQQERLHALGRMASGIAHDFNNALVPIVGLSELLLNSTAIPHAKSEEYLRLIHTAATDGAEVVRRLREFYRSRDERDIFASVSLNEVVRQVAALTRPRWKDQALGRGAQIQFEMELERVPPVSGCEAELRELLINLVFNAVDAIEHHGKISCRTFEHGGSVALQIKDTGCGMSEEVRLRCLEPFFSTKADHGTGLGLAMAFGIVRRHDGEMEVVSSPGTGTTITILLLPHDATNSPETNHAPAAIRVKPLKILVVDDEPSVREVLEAMLSEDGHIVTAAASGDEALDLFRSERWDLVMTDRAMPQMNGDILAARLKALAAEIPVILVTGFADVMRDVGDHPPGIDLIVRKPFTRDSLRVAVAAAVPEPPPVGEVEVRLVKKAVHS